MDCGYGTSHMNSSTKASFHDLKDRGQSKYGILYMLITVSNLLDISGRGKESVVRSEVRE